MTRSNQSVRWFRLLASFALVGAVVVAGVACGGDDSALSARSSGDYDPGTTGTGATGAGGAGGSTGEPPERELERTFEAPVGTGRFLWTANPSSGRIARIDPQTLQVQTQDAGLAPTYVAALPSAVKGEEAVGVLDVGLAVATVLRVDAKGAEARPPVRLATHSGANRWAVERTGAYAIAWTDAALVKNADITDGFQELTVLKLAPGAEQATRLSVGYRPRSVSFDAAGKRALVVCEPGVIVIDLTAAPPVALGQVKLSDDPLVDPASIDVTIDASGAFAVVRGAKPKAVSVVDLQLDETKRAAPVHVELASAPTDVDVSKDGKTVVAVARDSGDVVAFPLASAADASKRTHSTITGARVGSVTLSAGGERAVLFTNATDSSLLAVLDRTQTPSKQLLIDVKTAVEAVFPTNDATLAITFQRPSAGSRRAGAFSLVPLDGATSPYIVGTDAPPTLVALTDDGGRAIVTTSDDVNAFGAYLIDLPRQQAQLVPLASKPLAAGIVVGDGKSAPIGWISQQHAQGRLTFVNLDTLAARTITGFELAANVVD